MVFKKLLGTDWQKEFCAFFAGIDPLYKKTILYTFVVLNIVYAFHTVNFLWGNHDWSDVLDGVYNEHTYGIGRFSQYWLLIGLFDGKLLPVLNNFFAFLGLAFSGVALARYWRLPRDLFSYLGFSLFFATSPYFLPWLYYVKLTVVNAWLLFFAILALALSERSFVVKSGVKRLWFNFLAVLLIVYCLGVYPVVASTLVVVFVVRVFFARLEDEHSSLSKYLFVVVNGVVAVAVVKCILLYLQACGLMGSFYNTKMLGFSQIVGKLQYILAISFEQFVFATTFIDKNYKLALLALVCVSVFCYVAVGVWSARAKGKGYRGLFVGLGLMMLALFATKLVALVTPGDYVDFSPRVDYFGLLYFYLFALALLLKLPRPCCKNIALLFLLVLLPMAVLRDADAMKVWKLGFDAEQKLNERIIGRIEAQPSFDIDKKYVVIYIGNPLALRSNFYQPKTKDELTSVPMLAFCYSAVWPTTDHDMDFYYMTRFKKVSYNTDNIAHVNSKEFLKDFSDYVLHKAKAWPDKNSVYVDDKYIVVVYDNKALERAKTYLQQ